VALLNVYGHLIAHRLVAGDGFLIPPRIFLEGIKARE